MKKLLAACLFFCSFSSWAIEVVFINPTHRMETFWQGITLLAQDAASDLKINLRTHYADSHRVTQFDLISSIANSQHKPDYVIFMPYGGSIVRSFNELEKAKIPFVTLERVFDWQSVKEIALPRQKYKYWLGEMYHDNIKASRLLTRALLAELEQQKGKQEKYQAVGINGDYYSESLDRVEGLRIVSQQTPIELSQVVPANWSRHLAADKFKKLSQRYPNIDLIWAASDKMALGVLDVLKQDKDMLSADNFVLGGFDWLPEALTAIHNKQMTASVGGHFLQAAWAVVKIYDHHNGKSVFAMGDDTPHVAMNVVNKNNINQYMALTKRWDLTRVNFAEFCLSHPDNKQAELGYQLNADEFVKRLAAPTKAQLVNKNP